MRVRQRVARVRLRPLSLVPAWADPAHHDGSGQASYLGSGVSAEARGPKSREWGSGGGVLAPPHELRGLGERCKLPQRGPGQSPSR